MIHSDSMHQITLYTAQQKPVLEGDLRVFAVQGLRNLAGRFPGLKIVNHALYPNRVEMLLDFQRLDEDVQRVVQSFKSEVKYLAKKKGFGDDSLWQWNYDDHWVTPPGR